MQRKIEINLIIWVPPNAEPLGIKPSKDFFD
jgi:hypothetical protein